MIFQCYDVLCIRIGSDLNDIGALVKIECLCVFQSLAVQLIKNTAVGIGHDNMERSVICGGVHLDVKISALRKSKVPGPGINERLAQVLRLVGLFLLHGECDGVGGHRPKPYPPEKSSHQKDKEQSGKDQPAVLCGFVIRAWKCGGVVSQQRVHGDAEVVADADQGLQIRTALSGIT